MCPSQNSIASYRIYSETFPNSVVAKIQSHLIEIMLRPLQIVSAKILLHLIEIISRHFQIVFLPKFIISMIQAGLLNGAPPRSQPTKIPTQLRYSWIVTLLWSSRVNLTSHFLGNLLDKSRRNCRVEKKIGLRGNHQVSNYSEPYLIVDKT